MAVFGRVAGVVAAVALAVLLLVPQAFAVTLLSQVLVLAVFALGFDLMLGRAGLLSFGHALPFGLGAYATAHAALAATTAGSAVATSPLLVAALPAAGAMAGACIGAVTGWLATRRAGASFAMITLGLAELAAVAAPMFAPVFGGEGGVAIDRTLGAATGTAGSGGVDFGQPAQAAALIAAWSVAALLAVDAFGRTPLGLVAGAVRDEPERARALGIDPRRVRRRVTTFAGALGGLAGALSVLLLEVATVESLSPARSASVLLAACIGGIGHPAGPVLGALVLVLFTTALPVFTSAWSIGLGLLFVLVVRYLPGGLAGGATVAIARLRVACRVRGGPR